MALLDVRNVSIGYNGGILAKNLNLQLQGGDLTALLGRNGIGKSTLIRTITSELKPLSGCITINGTDINEIKKSVLSRLISLVTTETLQAGGLTTREIVSLGRQPYTGYFGKLGKEDKLIVEESMNEVGIVHKADSYFSELSDGEKQKAMIARAIAQDTPIIILDEPFSFLDVASRIEILSFLKTLCHRKGKGILFSSHDVSQALRMADRIELFTFDGHLIEGTPESLIEKKKISQLFDNRNVKFSESQFDFIENE